MKKTEIVFRSAMVLAVLTVFVVSAVPAVNAATAYFVPEDSSAEGGDYEYVTLYVDVPEGETFISWQVTLLFDSSHADTTQVSKNCDPYKDDTCFNTVSSNLTYTSNGYAWAFGYDPQEWDEDNEEWKEVLWFTGPRTVKCARFRIAAVNSPGLSLLDYGFDDWPSACPICLHSALINSTTGEIEDVTWSTGTFTHIGQPETYTRTFTDLGWNLISLPLTNDTDMTVSTIIDTTLSGSYDYLYKYDTATHNYVEMTSTDTMENGVGYFINITVANAEWEYLGNAYNMMNEALSDGLNMIGWLNCTKAISTTSLDDPTKTYYIARWDATTQEYETYNPAAPGDFNDFTQMDRGEGYFVSMKTSGTLSESC